MPARVALYGLTAALASFLLFTLELMVGRMLLPRLGGAPSAWNTALVFFQVALVVGYAWATLARLRRAVPFVVAAAALALLPIGVPSAWTPPVGAPARWTLAVLAARVGLPFVALATTGPSLQAWCASWLDSGRDPYPLFAASNAGSLAALVAYPTIVEPALGLRAQARWWSVGYVAYVVLLVGCALVGRGRALAVSAPASPTTWTQRAQWFGLAAVPSGLLLAVTRHLTVDIAPVALLWVVPLAVYLASFVVAFARRRPRAVRPVAAAATVASVIAVAVSTSGTPRQLIALTVLHVVAFAAACLTCHAWLADRRPPPEQLGAFYVWMAVGGAAGGVSVALVAPLVFDRVTEYPLALGLAAAIAAGAPGRRTALTHAALALAAGAATLAALRAFHGWIPSGQALLAGGVVAVAGVALLRRPRVAAVLLVPAVLFAARDVRGALLRERTFFGVYRVSVNERGDHVLGVGTTTHGVQRQGSDERRRPMAYYHPSAPLGHWFFDHAAEGPRAVGVVGLGVGAVAAYGRSGDHVDFYEIDPAIERIARDPRLFTYLGDSAAIVRVVIGDGRLALARARDRYDFLLVDAFGSDAIPTHLLTREAWGVYLARLAPGGTLAFHLSNRSLDLVPVVARVAHELGLTGFVADGTPNPLEAADGAFASTVVVVARDAHDVASFAARSVWRPLSGERLGSLWTDDRVDLLGALDVPR